MFSFVHRQIVCLQIIIRMFWWGISGGEGMAVESSVGFACVYSDTCLGLFDILIGTTTTAQHSQQQKRTQTHVRNYSI